MSVTNVQNVTKTVFGPAIEVIPEENSFADIFKFKESTKTGRYYEVSVEMSREQGFAYNSNHNAFALAAAANADWQLAQLEGAEIAGRAQIPYGHMAKMSGNDGDSKKAWKQAMGQTIASLMKSAEARREIALMYGPGATAVANLGVVNAVISAVGVNLTINLTRATWADGMWPVLIGAAFDCFAGGTSHTANAPLILTGVVQSQCRLIFTGNATDVGTVAPGDVLTFRGSRAVSCVGIEAILANTGTLFNISAANYPIWRAQTYNVAGALTFDKVVEGLVGPANNGLKTGGTLTLTAQQWTDCMTDEAALRRHVGDKMAKEIKTGASSLEYESAAGVVKIVRHPFAKQAQAWFLPNDVCERVGAQELSFKSPGSPNDWHLVEVADTTATEIRIYGDFAPLIHQPNVCVQYNGIASTADRLPS